jgi:hypothetical protein
MITNKFKVGTILNAYSKRYKVIRYIDQSTDCFGNWGPHGEARSVTLRYSYILEDLNNPDRIFYDSKEGLEWNATDIKIPNCNCKHRNK